MHLNKSHIGIGVVCLLAGIVLGFFLKGCKPSSPAEPIVLHDTIAVHDTFRITQHTKPKEVVKWDTCYLPAVDTIIDSIFVQVPITQYEYRDTFKTDSSRIELGVQFSGYHAKIESVDLNYDFTIPTKIVTKRQRFSWSLTIGLQGGYGATFGKGGVVEMRPYAGVGGTLGASINF